MGEAETESLQQEPKGQKNDVQVDLFKMQVSKCDKSGCKDEPLAAEEEKRVFF